MAGRSAGGRTLSIPCHDAFETGRPIIEQDLEDAIERWPVFAPKALDTGIQSVYAFPLRLRDTRVGAVNAFRYHSGSFEERDLHAGQALADVATIGIVQARVIREAHQRSEQLQIALDSRVLIEQAKGVLAERRAVDVGTAFEMLRRHARNHSLSIREVCRAVIDGDLGRSERGHRSRSRVARDRRRISGGPRTGPPPTRPRSGTGTARATRGAW